MYSDVVKFRSVLLDISEAEKTDLARFSDPLDHAVARKAYWRCDAIDQALLLLDNMALKNANQKT
jgi:hypothetical protein